MKPRLRFEKINIYNNEGISKNGNSEAEWVLQRVEKMEKKANITGYNITGATLFVLFEFLQVVIQNYS